jgi:ABC-type nitrate/sulfonate/bicarbonate transport system permease component
VVPILAGRLQTRAAALGLVGLLWTLLVTPAISVGHDLGASYRATLLSWLCALVFGLVLWEPLYHGLMQFRWEKDWPTLFLLLESIPESALVALALHVFGPPAIPAVFLAHFFSTWLVVLVVVVGPLRVPFIRWRFRGGRFG